MKTLLSLLLFLFAAVVLQAEDTAAMWQIDGVVRQKRADGSVAHAKIEVKMPEGGTSPDGQWITVAETKTDAEGKFHFESPPSQYFQVFIRKGDRKESHYIEGYLPDSVITIFASRFTE
ncbi:MAG: hypothetical protein Q7P63_08015 [Verrucomicrobiota bacterium JB022]|nr:hypothetical protein [Verrucomicrobiota bacterium JB022]